jgi:undecaprenyl diphosphate synthase
MASSPTISGTILDNLITRKEARADALRRVRARDRIEVFGKRKQILNKALDINSKGPAIKAIIKEKSDQIEYPNHLALIPDGNRRWAQARGLSVGEGYHVGSQKLEAMRRWAMIDNDVKVTSVFTLSTENIARRPEDELAQLYAVFADFFTRAGESEEVHENRIKHEVRGNTEGMAMLPDEVLDAINYMETETADYDRQGDPKIVILMPYGGRDEIVNAARRATSPLVEGGRESLTVSDMGEDENDFRENLLLGDLPDVDLMMRTSEIRLSNFMLYHNAYAEFVFFKKNWPSFTEADFYEGIYKYANRDRRFGV